MILGWLVSGAIGYVAGRVHDSIQKTSARVREGTEHLKHTVEESETYERARETGHKVYDYFFTQQGGQTARDAQEKAARRNAQARTQARQPPPGGRPAPPPPSAGGQAQHDQSGGFWGPSQDKGGPKAQAASWENVGGKPSEKPPPPSPKDDRPPRWTPPRPADSVELQAIAWTVLRDQFGLSGFNPSKDWRETPDGYQLWIPLIAEDQKDEIRDAILAELQKRNPDVQLDVKVRKPR